MISYHLGQRGKRNLQVSVKTTKHCFSSTADCKHATLSAVKYNILPGSSFEGEKNNPAGSPQDKV